MRQRSKLHWSKVVCRPWAIVVYNVEPTLGQRRNTIWVLSVIMKVFKSVIRKQIVPFLIFKGHLNLTQHGFRGGCSCLSALLSVFDDVMQLLSCGNNSVDMVYLDFEKAFDKVDHGGLLHKIKMLGITGKFGVWLYHFSTCRTHFVRLQGGANFDSTVISGLLQGRVLGPLLIILMCDNNGGITSSSMVSFADDTRLYYGIYNVDDCAILQNDLNYIYE